MSAAQPVSRRPWLTAAALCVIATAAIWIAVPTKLWHNGAPGTPDPLAPGLAALSDQQLADLLPRPADFPASWTVKSEHTSDAFGFSRSQPFHDPYGAEPAECRNVGELGVGATAASAVSAHNPADPPQYVPELVDIRLTIAREFNRDGFGAMIDLVSRCSRFDSGNILIYTVRVLEDSRPNSGPQRFRIEKTTAAADGSPSVARTDYFSFARTSGLILIGYGRNGNQQLLDTEFDSALNRIGGT
jgi:hypothetical protein